MKIVQLIFLFLGLSYVAQSQNTNHNWLIRASYGIEEHDKRLFDYSEKETLLEKQKEKWGTHQVSLSSSYIYRPISKLSFSAGIGLNYQLSTFRRPFDHFLFNQDLRKPLRVYTNYETYSMTVPVFIMFDLAYGCSVFIENDMFFTFFEQVNGDGEKNSYPYKLTKFEFAKLNTSFGIQYEYSHFLVFFKYRIYNLQRINEVIFNSIIKYNSNGEEFEEYNSKLLSVGVGYRF